MFFGQSLLFNIFCVCLAIFIAIIAYFKWQYQYWKRRGIPYIQPRIPFGTLLSSEGKATHLGTLLSQQYVEFKKQGAKLGGLYLFDDPALLILDLDYVKNVMAKDFNVFHSRGYHLDPKKNPTESNIALVDGTNWRTLRAKLTPTFSSGKIKTMFGTVIECLTPFNRKLDELYQNSESVLVKEFISSYVTDVMVSSSFGISSNSFDDEEGPFRKYAHSFEQTSNWTDIIQVFTMKCPFILTGLKLSALTAEAKKFYVDVVRDTINHRLTNNVKRNDFMDMMVQLMKDGVFAMEDVFAQSFAFFLAGYEPSAMTSTSALYMLAKHPGIQAKVREEIATVLERYEGEMTYEGVHEMKYLDQVIAESQRLFPVGTHVFRRCMEDYKFPDQDLIIKKGTLVAVPIYAIHQDPEYFPDPVRFDPERFSPENKGLIRPFTFMPFGEGPRMCIAARFALLISKVAIIEILRTYRVTINKKTVEPMQKDPTKGVLNIRGDIYLNIHKG